MSGMMKYQEEIQGDGDKFGSGQWLGAWSNDQSVF